MSITNLSWGSDMKPINRLEIPIHLRHLEEWRLKALFYLFRASL
jgi:hypothetical protein